uniref:Lipoprotein n=1 Tax=Panagrellus redivivus TaxID=6233 RepID=A0A7E4W5P5_PANRE
MTRLRWKMAGKSEIGCTIAGGTLDVASSACRGFKIASDDCSVGTVRRNVGYGDAWAVRYRTHGSVRMNIGYGMGRRHNIYNLGMPKPTPATIDELKECQQNGKRIKSCFA